ncbi:unnamed protein product [Penicillium discolor]
MNSSLAFLWLNSFGPTIAVGLAMDRRVIYSTSGADGPIPNKNPDWKPAAYTNAIASGAKRYDIKAADITANPPPNRAVVLNKEGTGVCDVAVNRDQMCDLAFGDRVSLRRHLHNDHPGVKVAPGDYRRTEHYQALDPHQRLAAGQLRLRAQLWIYQGYAKLLVWHHGTNYRGPVVDEPTTPFRGFEPIRNRRSMCRNSEASNAETSNEEHEDEVEVEEHDVE